MRDLQYIGLFLMSAGSWRFPFTCGIWVLSAHSTIALSVAPCSAELVHTHSPAGRGQADYNEGQGAMDLPSVTSPLYKHLTR